MRATPGLSAAGLRGPSDTDWKFHTTPQENAKGRSIWLPRLVVVLSCTFNLFIECVYYRGKVLGGCGTVCVIVYLSIT